MKRPLMLLSIFLIIGILTGKYIHSYACVFLITALMFPLTYNIFKKHPSYTLILIGSAIFFLIGGISYIYQDNKVSTKFSEFYDKEILIQGRINSESNIKDKKISCTVYTEAIKQNGISKKIHGKILLSTLSDINNFEFGKEITVIGTLKKPRANSNPMGFNYKNYLSSSGISATIFAQKEKIKIFPQTHNSLIKLGVDIRNSLVHTINLLLPPNQAALLSGMLIGYRDGLPKEIQNMFSDAGLTHIMAVSGANIAFIIFPLVFIFKKLHIKMKVYNIIIIILLVCFIFITGFEPSVLRAVIMAIIILLGQIINRDSDIFTTISFSVILLLLYNPYTLFNIGFQLSYAATLGLIIITKRINDSKLLKVFPNYLKEAFSTTLAAQIAVIPISTYYFNKVSIISIISNMIVVPIVGIITILGMIMVVIGQISIALAKILGYLNYILLSFVLFVTKNTAVLPYSVIKIITPSILLVIIYYFAILYFFWYKPKYNTKIRAKFIIPVIIAFIIFLSVSALIPKELEVVFLDVGQGDSTFIKTHSGKTILIDAGGYTSTITKDSNQGDTVVIPFLLDYGVMSLDLVIATHAHDDHILGLTSVLKNIDTKTLAIPLNKDYAEYNKILNIATTNRVKTISLSQGESIKIDNKTKLNVLYPSANNRVESNSENNNSLVFKLLYKNFSILFTADAEQPVEQILLNEGLSIKSDVIKISHHGSITSSSESFLNAVNAKAAVISVGKNNFGHPSKIVLDRLKKVNVKTFRTDENGAVIVKSNGGKFSINTVLY